MSSVLTESKGSAPHPRILLLGRNGQVGGDLQPLLAAFSELLATERASLDLTRPDTIRECIRAFRPDVIVNAAAYTAVDKAESEPEIAATINATAPRVLAEEARRRGALLIHYSTDYVFDGTKVEPYIESDRVNPLNVYGRTKAAGEEAIKSVGCNHLIFRTSWVYSLRGSNFLLTILRLARERDELRIVDDQVGAPTSSELIAHATVDALKQWLSDGDATRSNKNGLYHLTSSGHVSWFGFAEEIIRLSGNNSLRVKKITPIPSRDYPTPAQRPHNSQLDCSKLRTSFGIEMPAWQSGLSSVLASPRNNLS